MTEHGCVELPNRICAYNLKYRPSQIELKELFNQKKPILYAGRTKAADLLRAAAFALHIVKFPF